MIKDLHNGHTFGRWPINDVIAIMVAYEVEIEQSEIEEGAYWLVCGMLQIDTSADEHYFDSEVEAFQYLIKRLKGPRWNLSAPRLIDVLNRSRDRLKRGKQKYFY